MRGGERGREREREGGGGDRVRGERENKWEITFRKREILFEFSPKPKAQDSAQKVIYSTGGKQKSPGDVYTFNQKVEYYGVKQPCSRTSSDAGIEYEQLFLFAFPPLKTEN